MAKVKYQYFGLEMSAEGKESFVGDRAAEFMEYVKQENKRTEERKQAENRAECVQLTKPQPVAAGVDCDVVAIYDNAGLPSIMRRFRRVTNAELFGGSDKVHPAFTIGDDVYDEIFISVYENTMIDGKPYSLPNAEPATNITVEDFAQACFSKGEGWHCLTAAEWGLLALTSLKLGTLPHGNTKVGEWHGDEAETGKILDGTGKTATGTGPATWTHDHTATGVHDLCGNVWEFCRGMRVLNGAVEAAKNNDAAMPETDLTENGSGWKSVVDDEGAAIFVSVADNEVSFTNKCESKNGYTWRKWGDVTMDCESEQLKALAFFAGEPDALCYVDSTEGEYILVRGGGWSGGSDAGVFDSNLYYGRSEGGGVVGGRSAFYKKHCNTEH